MKSLPETIEEKFNKGQERLIEALRKQAKFEAWESIYLFVKNIPYGHLNREEILEWAESKMKGYKK